MESGGAVMKVANLELARNNMIEQQIRPWNVLDLRVLELLKKVRREQFVPGERRDLAFMDIEIPLGHGAFMWQPKLEARALQALRVRGNEHVLEIGTGSGYLTALLARQASRVTSVEIVPELKAFAGKNLESHRIENVTLEQGDAAHGWRGSYDAVILTGSVPMLPDAFRDCLKPGGRLFAIVGDGPAMTARLYTRGQDAGWDAVDLFETSVAPLRNALQPERFVF